MMSELVSIVVPIYNVEKYLERCIKSITNQTYKNLEIILVDDESPDRCPYICEEWKKRDKRIIVVHKKNSGLGMARNTGIDIATGDYIIFVDSDDYIDEHTVEYSLKTVHETGAQIVRYGYNDVIDDKTILHAFIPHMGKNVFSGYEVAKEFLPDSIAKDYTNSNEITGMSAWLYCINMKLIREINWHFVSEREIISEDTYSMLKLYAHVNRVALLPYAFYYYCKNPTSLTNTYREDRYQKIKEYYDNMMILCDECGYEDEIRHRVSSVYLSFVIAAIKMVIHREGSWKSRYDEIKSIITDLHMQRTIRTVRHEIESTPRKMLISCIKNKQIIVIILLLLLRGMKSC